MQKAGERNWKYKLSGQALNNTSTVMSNRRVKMVTLFINNTFVQDECTLHFLNNLYNAHSD